jgi:hypothetical protein
MGMGNPIWWRDLGERVLRNEIQALLPLLAVVSTAGAGIDWMNLALSALYVAVWTVVKGLAFSTFSYTPTGWSATAWRVGSAVAASLVANVPERFWGYDHWDRVGYSAIGAVISCLFMLYGTPPTEGAASASSGDSSGDIYGQPGDSPGMH